MRIFQGWQARIESFFKRRSPLCQQITLSQRNIYIFFSKEGIMYALLLVITFIAGINYGNNLVLGLCFFLASLLVVTIPYTFLHLSKLQIKLIDIHHAQVGDKVQIRLQISSNNKQPHRQICLSFIKDVFSCKDSLQRKPAIANQAYVLMNQVKEPQIISLWLPTSQRGRLDLPRLIVSTVYPLGILQAWSYVFFEGHAWVYPEPLSYDIQAIQNVKSDTKQSMTMQNQSGQDDFDQLDNYVVGESLSRVSWSHLARGQGLLSKRFIDPVGQEQLLDYYQMPALNHEDKLKQLRYGIDQLSQNHLPFQLRLPDSEGVVGQGQAFEQESLLRLAKTR